MKTILPAIVLAVGLAAGVAANEHSIFPGDGSDQPGFVPPPAQPRLPPPPPRSISSAETTIPAPPPPVVPMARTESKKPPRPPVLFTKLKTDHLLDWSATPNDVNNLLKRMQAMIDVNYIMEIKSLSEISADPQHNPVLYRSGHYHFEFTPEERDKLRRFMLDGGMLILNTGLGSKPFYDSARRELELIFPEVHVQRLSSDHPVFHAYYNLDRVNYRSGVHQAGFRGNEPWFDGVTINCRTVAVISRWGMAVGWEENENDAYQAYVSEDAQRLGVNLFTYATHMRAWTKQAARQMVFVDREQGAMDRMFMVQVVYDGEWKTRHAGLSVLMQAFNLKTGIPVRYGVRELRLSDPRIFDSPLLYLSGHEHFTLPENEIAHLRQYLSSGGLLFAEACCGRRGFDLAFRELMARVFPGRPLQAVEAGDPIFAIPNAIQQVGVTPALAGQVDSAVAEPRLQAVEVDGHKAVIYSPFGLAGAWEMSQVPYAFGYDTPGAMRLGQNILMYAITQ